MVRTRIAPSPTGYPHIGTIYQAMFDYVFAKKFDGSFIVRIEDTDRARFVEGAEEVVFTSLDWFGLAEDESPRKGGDFKPYRSSERLEIYKKYVDQLVADSKAYRCFCTKERLEEMRAQQQKEKKTPRYDRTCFTLSEDQIQEKMKNGISFVVRMKIPDNRKIIVEDAILGKVEFDSGEIDDQVILKSDGYPTYHLAVVVDDYLMKITHVFRGQEWLPSTPKHILLYEFLGWENSIPQFIHLPVILNTEGGGKLSKRHGHASVDYYKEQGFLPEAILNYLANIVWNHPDGKEIYDFRDLSKAFKVDPQTKKIEHVEIYSQGPKFDLKKLEWMNGEYIRQLSVEELTKRLSVEEELLKKFVPLAQERIKTLNEFEQLVKPFVEKASKDLNEEEKSIAQALVEKFESLSDWNKDEILNTIRTVLSEKNCNMKVIYKITTGFPSGLPLADVFELIGKDKTLELLK